MSTTSQTLSALRALRYSAAKLADIITDGIADAEVRLQVRAACLLELSWVDTLLAGDEPKLIAVACEGCGCVWESYDGHSDRIERCPNCPMSEAEFEALKASVRNRLHPAPVVDADEPRQ